MDANQNPLLRARVPVLRTRLTERRAQLAGGAPRRKARTARTRRAEVGFFCVTRYSHQPPFTDEELAAMRHIVDHLARALEIEDRLARPAEPQIFESLPYGLALLDRHSRGNYKN